MKNRHLAASFSVEGAYVFSILFLALALVFQYAFRERDMTAAGCLLSEGAEEAAHLEPLYDPEGPSADEIASALYTRSGILGMYRGAAPEIALSSLAASASLDGEVPLFSRRTVSGPETVMRAATALDRFRRGR